MKSRKDELLRTYSYHQVICDSLWVTFGLREYSLRNLKLLASVSREGLSVGAGDSRSHILECYTLSIDLNR
jgi:hypothetical protein